MNTYEHKEPFVFVFGYSYVLAGWEKGLADMCPGEKRKLIVPPHLGFGEQGSPPRIPPNATLIYTIDLVEIERPELDEDEEL
jgi:FKBP-type peptidyl-prolyl cis-trans isomerase